LIAEERECFGKDASDEQKKDQEAKIASARCESVPPRLTCGQFTYASQVCDERVERTDQLLACLERVKAGIVPGAVLFTRARDPSGIGEGEGKNRKAKREWLESVLVSHARILEQNLAGKRARIDQVVKPAVSASELEVGELTKLRDDAACLAKRLVTVRSAVQLQPSDALFVDHRNYEAWTSRFSLGGEYLSISKIGSDEVFPLASVAIYRNYATWERWRRPQVMLEFRLSSSGEEVSLSGLAKDGKVAGANALDTRAAFFWPVARLGASIGEEAKLRELIGPVVDFGVRKTDDDSSVGQRQYGGLRIAANPEWFAEVLYGKTEGITEHRVEVRTQMPVSTVASGQRIYLGAIYNFGASGEARSTKSKELSPDVVRVFLTWNVEFKRLFGIK
jgi:hypothetical protein